MVLKNKIYIYIPLNIVLGFFSLAGLTSLIGVSIDDELNPDYYKYNDEPMFKEKDDKK